MFAKNQKVFHELTRNFYTLHFYLYKIVDIILCHRKINTQKSKPIRPFGDDDPILSLDNCGTLDLSLFLSFDSHPWYLLSCLDIVLVVLLVLCPIFFIFFFFCLP